MKMWNGICNIIMNFPLSNKLYRLWRNANRHWLILTHPYEDSLPPQQQFGVIHHCAYFVGSLVFNKYYNVYLPTFSLFFSTLTRQPLNHVLKQYQESGHYCSHLLHSEWPLSPTKSLYVELHQKVGRMKSLPLVSSLSNKNMTAYLLPKVTLWELWVPARRMWNPVGPETEVLLRRQTHAQVTGSLTVVSDTDPETVPSSCRISYILVWSWFCHQHHLLGDLLESYSLMPQVTSLSLPALVPVIDAEVAWGLTPPLLATSHTLIFTQGLFSRHIFPCWGKLSDLGPTGNPEATLYLGSYWPQTENTPVHLGIFQETLPSEPQRKAPCLNYVA